MKHRRTLVIVLIGVVLAAAVMVLLSFTVKDIHDVAVQAANDNKLLRLLGRTGIVIAGLFAPIVYLVQRVGKWLRSLFARFGSSKQEQALEKRNDEIEKKLASLREEVRRLDLARQQELAAARDRVEKLEAVIAVSRQQVATNEAAVEATINRLEHARATHAAAELLEIAKRSPYYDPGIPLPEEPHP